MNARWLEYHARNLWPLQRRFLRLTARCKHCILSARCTPLSPRGICGECYTYATTNSAATTSPDLGPAFDETIRSYVGQGPRYDALLLLSGGKDSAYILQRLRTIYPALRILCLLVDNGFLAPIAGDNALQAAWRTETNLLIDRANLDRFRATFRKAFLETKGRGCAGIVDHADGTLIFEIGAHTATEFKIPLGARKLRSVA